MSDLRSDHPDVRGAATPARNRREAAC